MLPIVRRVVWLLCFVAATVLVVTPLQSCTALPSANGDSPIVDKIPPKQCNGTCDVDECDFIDNMCLNRLDLHPGTFSLPGNSCKGNTFGLIFELFLFAYAMLGLAIVCDDHLCVALERLCDELMIREDVAGATFMAFGSAAPEIIVNTVSTLKQARKTTRVSLDATNLGVGAILGSGMIAFLIIPGACALATGEGIQLLLKRRPLLRDVCAYALALLLLCIFFHDGKITTLESGIMVGVYVCYVIVVVVSPKIRREYRHRILKRPKKKHKSFVVKKGTNATDVPLLDPKDLENAPDFSSVPTDGSLTGEADDAAPRRQVSFEDEEEGTGNNYEVTLVPTSDPTSNPEGEDEEPPPGCFGRFIQTISRPLTFMFEWTCINCDEGTKYEKYYPLTFVVSFLWVAWFSMIISACVERWTNFTPEWAKGSFFGLLTIAVGAEIPDTIQSVTMAKRGYGSMAVSNALGSQIINILIGLGLPWFFANLANPDANLLVTDHANLQFAAFFQFGAVGLNFVLLLGFAVMHKANKALLTPQKGKFFLFAYVVVVGSYVIMMLSKTKGSGCPN